MFKQFIEMLKRLLGIKPSHDVPGSIRQDEPELVPEVPTEEIPTDEGNEDILPADSGFAEENIPTPSKLKYFMFGINKYNPLKWGDCNLNGCVNDVTRLASLVSAKGYTGETLTDLQVTSQAIEEHITQLAQEALPGDTIVLSYSGHGTYTMKGLERITGIVLQDKVFWDFEMRKLLVQFKKGVNIVWISDSCHSENNYKAFQESEALAAGESPKDTTGIPKLIILPSEEKALLDKMSTKVEEDIQCYITALMSSQDTEVSYDTKVDGRPHGAFIGSLIQAYFDNNQVVTVDNLYNSTYTKVTTQWPQHPKLELTNCEEETCLELLGKKFLTP